MKPATLTPRPARKVEPPAREEEARDQWLDAIDPERTRYTDPDRLVQFKRWPTLEDVEEWLLHIPDYQRSLKSRKLKDYREDLISGYWINGIVEVVFDRYGDLIQGQHFVKPGNPILALRKKFEKLKKEERWRSGPTLAHMIVAWNLLVSGEKCQTLPFRIGQPFPEVSAPLAPVESSRSSSRIH